MASTALSTVDSLIASLETSPIPEQTHEEKQDANALPTVDNATVIKKWNKMPKFYTGTPSKFMFALNAALYPHLQLHTNPPRNDDDNSNGKKSTFKLLEIAVGDGFNSVRLIKELLSSKPSGFEYHGIDIAPQMVDICNSSIENDALISTFLQHHNHDQRYRISVSAQNGEDLSLYNERTFDRCVANMCLMITGNALTMLQQTYRVLKTNGISVWSIWGHRERGMVFESIEAVMHSINEELGITSVSSGFATRSNYYLGDNMTNTVRLFKRAGFRQVMHWSVDVALPVNTAEQWSDAWRIAPSFEAVLKKCKDDAQREKVERMFTDGIERRFKQYVETENRAITHNAICIVAVK
eukprot:CAMPEP_0197029350 /NCGR_PEP_ID=MMETSP1384-20130603/8809_1 /TAXON_ID=29189 /ORGANISM="Ammonia sp." /LENGTH=353 /DNA_ID=CAMNT_0042458493 /DNA_START=18 /DNA_END=1079 /DNA_ORIENTATION=+